MCGCVCVWDVKNKTGLLFRYFEGGTSLVVLAVCSVLLYLCVCALRPGPTVDTQFSVLFSLVCCRWIKHFHGLWADREWARESERAASNLRIKCVLHTSHAASGNATYAWCVFKVCVYAMHNGRQRHNTRVRVCGCVCVCVYMYDVCMCTPFVCHRNVA